MNFFEEEKREFGDFSDFKKRIWEDGKNVFSEMRKGKKKTHWIWYFFPQLECLGMSYNSKFYGIKSLQEAEMFLHDNMLRTILIMLTKIVKVHMDKNRKIFHIFGCIDDKKFLSCMTLFYYASLSLQKQGVDYGCLELFDFCMKYAEDELEIQDTKTIELCEQWLEEEEDDNTC